MCPRTHSIKKIKLISVVGGCLQWHCTICTNNSILLLPHVSLVTLLYYICSIAAISAVGDASFWDDAGCRYANPPPPPPPHNHHHNHNHHNHHYPEMMLVVSMQSSVYNGDWQSKWMKVKSKCLLFNLLLLFMVCLWHTCKEHTKQVLKMKLGTIALSFLIHLRLIVATCVICAQAHRPPALCGLHQWRRQRHHHFCHCHRHHRHCQYHHQIWLVGGVRGGIFPLLN